MKKTNGLWTILNLIFLVIFNVLFFTLGGVEHRVSVWVSYGFIHFAYFMLLLTPKLTRAGKSSAVFGFSLYAISATYFLAEFVIGLLFILLSLEGYKAALLLQLCLAGAYGALLVSHLLANEATGNAEEKRQPQIDYVKNASIRLKLLLGQIQDKEARRHVERAYDALYSSPVHSYPELAQIEKRILQSIEQLENIISAGDKGKIMSSAHALLAIVNERNMRLRNSG
ncbi:MAG: hypothetical protein FWH27_09995 [Planctomycetaceae bacterium]|nr:hypothetical protein [Planctomycetaceae bacterium]